jgi:hypothetical protein
MSSSPSSSPPSPRIITIIMQETTLKEMEDNNYTLFFEFKHYKPKAKKVKL